MLANLFSGVLIEAAVAIASSVASAGELWLSGILRVQQDEVLRAYCRLGLRLLRRNTRGKWVLLQLAAPMKIKPAARRTRRR